MKGGFCVSTVSIVSGRAPRVDGCPRGLHLLDRRRLARPMIVIVIADDADGADGADGIFGPRVDRDYPGSSSAFTTEGNVDAQYPQERLSPAQPACEGPRVLGPNRGAARKAEIRQGGAGTQEV
jgi:hypothetical protein